MALVVDVTRVVEEAFVVDGTVVGEGPEVVDTEAATVYDGLVVVYGTVVGEVLVVVDGPEDTGDGDDPVVFDTTKVVNRLFDFHGPEVDDVPVVVECAYASENDGPVVGDVPRAAFVEDVTARVEEPPGTGDDQIYVEGETAFDCQRPARRDGQLGGD